MHYIAPYKLNLTDSYIKKPPKQKPSFVLKRLLVVSLNLASLVFVLGFEATKSFCFRKKQRFLHCDYFALSNNGSQPKPGQTNRAKEINKILNKPLVNLCN